MKVDSIKEKIESFWDDLAEGWRHLRQIATGALTRFKTEESTNLPQKSAIDDRSLLPGRSWAMIGGDVFEDARRLVVRLELPGMEKEQIEIEVHQRNLLVAGEKRFESETSDGRWRVMQCAYGSFVRKVPLPCAILSDQARASYKNGVLRIELPKAQPGQPKRQSIRIA